MYPLSPNSSSASITEGPEGDLWFTENLDEPGLNPSVAIGQITPAGQIQTFALPKKVDNGPWVGNITVGPDGNLWFPISYGYNSRDDIGRITAKGNVKMYHVFSSSSPYPPPPPKDIISGPDGKLWYQGTVHGKTGIARISTSGKLGPFIPIGNIESNMVRLPNGQVSFESQAADVGSVNELGVATRSGIVATQDLPAPDRINYSSISYTNPYSGGRVLSVMTNGPDGNLWATGGASDIVRISGLDTIDVPAIRRHGR